MSFDLTPPSNEIQLELKIPYASGNRMQVLSPPGWGQEGVDMLEKDW